MWNSRGVTQSDDRPAETPAGANGVLVLALVVGLLRFAALGRWSLWLDEVYTLTDALHGKEIRNPLGYTLFAWFYSLTGSRPDELLLRLPAAVFGWCSIPLTAWCLRPFVGRRAAAFAALVVALSPWHLLWSQTARFYTLAGCLVLCGTRWTVDGLRGRDHGAVGLVGGLLALAAAAATHPSAVLTVAGVVGVTLLARVTGRWPGGAEELRRAHLAWRILVVTTLVGAAAGSLWVIRVWTKWDERQGSGSPVHLLLSAGYLVTPGVGIGLLAGLWTILRRRLAWAAFLLGVLLAGAAVALGASFFVRVSAQYVFVFLPLVAGIAALPFGLPASGARERVGRSLLLAVVLLPLAVETGLYFFVRNGDRPMWREAYHFVFVRRDYSDLVVGVEAPVGEYYWNPASDDLRKLTQVVYLNEFHADVPREWARYGRRTWLIVNHEQLEDWPALARDELRRMLRESCRLVESFTVPWNPRDLDVHVYLFEPEA